MAGVFFVGTRCQAASNLMKPPASANATMRSSRGRCPTFMTSYSGATTPANRSKSVISNVSASARGSVGVQPGSCLR